MDHFNYWHRDGEDIISPKTLKEMCINVCAAKPNEVLLEETESENGSQLKLRSSLNIPPDIMENILLKCNHRTSVFVPLMMELSNNIGRMRITSINLNSCKFLTDANLNQIMQINPTRLEIHNCPLLSKASLGIINKYGGKLELLNLGNTSNQIISMNIENWVASGRNSLAEADWDLTSGILNTPNLKQLIMWDMKCRNVQSKCKFLFDEDIDFVEWLTHRFINKLEYLDLSHCFCLENPDFLLKAKDSLKYLFLNQGFSIKKKRFFVVLKYLTKLMYLHIPFCEMGDSTNGLLKTILTNLKKLRHLDISRTDLANNRCRIETFRGLHERPLQFMNLTGTGISNHTPVPSCIVIRNDDMDFDDLMTAIKFYIPGHIPQEIACSLELICNMREMNKPFPWRIALPLLFRVVSGTLNKIYSEHPIELIFEMFNKAYLLPYRLTQVEYQLILHCFIKLLRWEWDTPEQLHSIILNIYQLFISMNAWTTENGIRLVPALIRATTNAINMYNGCSTDDKLSCIMIFRDIDEYISCNLTISTAVELKTPALEKELLELENEMNKLSTLPLEFKRLRITLWKLFMD